MSKIGSWWTSSQSSRWSWNEPTSYPNWISNLFHGEKNSVFEDSFNPTNLTNNLARSQAKEKGKRNEKWENIERFNNSIFSFYQFRLGAGRFLIFTPVREKGSERCVPWKFWVSSLLLWRLLHWVKQTDHASISWQTQHSSRQRSSARVFKDLFWSNNTHQYCQVSCLAESTEN